MVLDIIVVLIYIILALEHLCWVNLLALAQPLVQLVEVCHPDVDPVDNGSPLTELLLQPIGVKEDPLGVGHLKLE